MQRIKGKKERFLLKKIAQLQNVRGLLYFYKNKESSVIDLSLLSFLNLSLRNNYFVILQLVVIILIILVLKNN